MGGVLYACPLGGRTWKEWGRGRGHVQHAFSSLTVNSEDDRFGVRPRLETGRTSLHLKHMPALKAFARARAKKITSRKVRAKQAREGGQEAARAPSKARAAIKARRFWLPIHFRGTWRAVRRRFVFRARAARNKPLARVSSETP